MLMLMLMPMPMLMLMMMLMMVRGVSEKFEIFVSAQAAPIVSCAHAPMYGIRYSETIAEKYYTEH